MSWRRRFRRDEEERRELPLRTAERRRRQGRAMADGPAVHVEHRRPRRISAPARRGGGHRFPAAMRLLLGAAVMMMMRVTRGVAAAAVADSGAPGPISGSSRVRHRRRRQQEALRRDANVVLSEEAAGEVEASSASGRGTDVPPPPTAHVDASSAAGTKSSVLADADAETMASVSSSSGSSSSSSSSSSSYDLVQGLRVRYTFTDRYQCHPGMNQEIPRLPLPDTMDATPGLVDFFPHWRGPPVSRDDKGSSPLLQKVIVVGDSIATQISQVIDEATGATERRLIRNHLVGTRNEQEWTHVSQSSIQERGDETMDERWTPGRLVVAGMRLRHLMLNSTKEKGDPASSSKWNPKVVSELLRQEVNVPRSTATEPIGQFDVMVQRIPHGWISLQDITHDNLRENARNAAEQFGIETLILINLPLINNVVEYEGKEGYVTLLQKRQVIRDFAASWRPAASNNNEASTIRLRHIMVLELGDLVDEMIEWNARIMGFNTFEPYQDWMLGHTLHVDEGPLQKRRRNRNRRLQRTAAANSKPSYYNHKVAHKCGVRVADTATACPRNSITYDGMHLCMSTLGGRIVAGVACLIDCGHKDNQPSNDAPHELRECESRCNEQFMSARPVPASLLRHLP